MEENNEFFGYDDSEPGEAWWDEPDEDEAWEEPVEEPEEDTVKESPVLNEILETLSGTQSYGTMGDYYSTALGCYVFPGYEVYAYFIDTEASGHEWTVTSDGHYIPLQYLEKYEGYISDDGPYEEPEEGPVEVLPTETELETLETLESVRGLLSVIKENDTSFYDEVREYQAEMLITEQKTAAMTEGILYCSITECILLGIIGGSFVAHTFFNRMRAG